MAEHEFGNGTGFVRAIKAMRCSLQGLAAAWQHESAFRQELCLALPFLGLSAWLCETSLQFALLLLTVVLVLVVELLNSALECVVDRIGTEHNELSGRAKDIASAAVFLSLLMPPICLSLIIYNNHFTPG